MSKRFRPWDPKQKWLFLAKVKAEWQLVCTAHNLLKLARASSRQDAMV